MTDLIPKVSALIEIVSLKRRAKRLVLHCIVSKRHLRTMLVRLEPCYFRLRQSNQNERIRVRSRFSGQQRPDVCRPADAVCSLFLDALMAAVAGYGLAIHAYVGKGAAG